MGFGWVLTWALACKLVMDLGLGFGLWAGHSLWAAVCEVWAHSLGIGLGFVRGTCNFYEVLFSWVTRVCLSVV